MTSPALVALFFLMSVVLVLWVFQPEPLWTGISNLWWAVVLVALALVARATVETKRTAFAIDTLRRRASGDAQFVTGFVFFFWTALALFFQDDLRQLPGVLGRGALAAAGVISWWVGLWIQRSILERSASKKKAAGSED